MKKQIAKKVSKEMVSKILKNRDPFSHKGDYGKAILIVGSHGKMGAATLASEGCLRSGVGLLTVYTPTCGYNILQTIIPEAMVLCDEDEKVISSIPDLSKYNALGIGCGIGTSRNTAKALKQVIQNFTYPLVIDADAINIISKNKEWLKSVPSNSIFTPHAKEFERLVGKSTDENDRKRKQIEFSQEHNVYVILKGHQTAISCPNGKVFLNSTGNAGMAKGGSGDVLTGILTAFLAQGYTPEQACKLGVYIHGLAGDIAARENSEHSMLATDLINALGKAFLGITEHKNSKA